MLGLAMKAGKVVIGTEQVIAYLQKGKLSLVLVSGNASEGTKNKIRFKCEFYKTTLTEVEVETDELGRLLGKTYAPAVVGITDENFSKTIGKILSGENA
jgi:ribosomal protein L7Ae-like RNA K-turn-binding protein